MQHVARWVLLPAEHLVQWLNPAPCVLPSVFVALMQDQRCGGLGAVRVSAALCRSASFGVVGTAVLWFLIFKQGLRVSFHPGRALGFLLWHHNFGKAGGAFFTGQLFPLQGNAGPHEEPSTGVGTWPSRYALVLATTRFLSLKLPLSPPAAERPQGLRMDWLSLNELQHLMNCPTTRASLSCLV